jgi:hypothetical protein
MEEGVTSPTLKSDMSNPLGGGVGVMVGGGVGVGVGGGGVSLGEAVGEGVGVVEVVGAAEMPAAMAPKMAGDVIMRGRR